MRTLYEILLAGPQNSDESNKVREAGWIWTFRSFEPGCSACGAWDGVYLKDGICLGCRRDQRARVDAAWYSDAALASSCEGPTKPFTD